MTFFKNCLFLVKHASRLTSLNRKLNLQARLASSTQLNSVQLSSTQFESAQLSSIQLDSALNFQTCFVLFFLILNFSNYQPGNLASFLNFECLERQLIVEILLKFFFKTTKLIYFCIPMVFKNVSSFLEG